MLEINDLKNFKNGSPTLKGINLKINKGEFVSILGPKVQANNFIEDY